MIEHGLNSDMLRLASANIEGAKFFCSKGNDEVYLNYAGYHCSQAAEKLIKFYILSKGVIPPKFHILVELFNFMENKGINSPVFSDLEGVYVLIDTWRSETRYVVSHIATASKIERVILILEELLKLLNPLAVASQEEIKSAVASMNIFNNWGFSGNRGQGIMEERTRETVFGVEFCGRFGQPIRLPFSLNYDLECHLLNSILPKYLDLVSGHSIGHIMKVVKESVALAQEYKLRTEMCVVVACYHDIGLLDGRKYHEKRSAEFMRNDKNLLRWFSSEEIEIMAQAVEDHRSSSGKEPRSIYGKVVSEADRDLDPEIVFRRYAEIHRQYGISVNPNSEERVFDLDEGFELIYSDLWGKFMRGQCKLWLESSRNVSDLGKLRVILADKSRAKEMYEDIYQKYECELFPYKEK